MKHSSIKINSAIFLRCLLAGLLLTMIFRDAAFCQSEKFTSRLYFPGLIGFNIPSGDEQTSVRSGFSLVTSMEYRPQYTNYIFFRFNYDALSNRYKSFGHRVPTNVTEGKLSANFFLLGVGYRRQVGGLAVYALIQPGINNSNYNTVSNTANGIYVGDISSRHASVKFSTGVEYYIVKHFALVAEPSFYHLWHNHFGPALNANYLSYNIRFTTTLF